MVKTEGKNEKNMFIEQNGAALESLSSLNTLEQIDQLKQMNSTNRKLINYQRRQKKILKILISNCFI